MQTALRPYIQRSLKFLLPNHLSVNVLLWNLWPDNQKYFQVLVRYMHWVRIILALDQPPCYRCDDRSRLLTTKPRNVWELTHCLHRWSRDLHEQYLHSAVLILVYNQTNKWCVWTNLYTYIINRPSRRVVCSIWLHMTVGYQDLYFVQTMPSYTT